MKKALDYLAKVQIVIGAIFLFIFMVTVCIQMACRYLSIAATWTDDVSMYSFIWAVFMGAAAMVYERRHFAFTSAADMIKSQKAKTILALVINIIMICFTILMIKYGIEVTKQFWNYKWTNIPSLNRGPTWMCLPICGITSTIYLAAQIVENVMILVKGGDKQ